VRAKTIAALVAATAIAGGLVVPAGASAAKPEHYSQKPSVSVDLQVRGTHGFQLDLFSSGPRGVILSATKWASRDGAQYVSYFSVRRNRPKTFDEGRLNVRIGHLGHFRGRFVPTSTETRELDPGCKGDPSKIETGFFAGSFAFRGERGYTVVHSHRARGTVTRQAAGTCTSNEPPWHESAREIKEEKERESNEFHLVAGTEGASVLFQARREEATKKMPGAGQTTFQASINGKPAGDFQVSYGVFLFGLDGDAATFQTPNLAEPPAEATLAPPAPFSGSATFHLDDPKTASWTGDLAVEMPGLGKVPLTGKGIDAGLCKGQTDCTKTLPKDLQTVLEAPANVIVTVSKPHK